MASSNDLSWPIVTATVRSSDFCSLVDKPKVEESATPRSPLNRAQRKIPLSPPAILNCREIPPAFPSKYAKDAHFSRFFLSKPDCGERTARQRGGISLAFLWRAYGQSGFETGISRMQCDHKPAIRPRRVDFCQRLRNQGRLWPDLCRPPDSVSQWPQG